ncbi:hypothetical protein P8C59_005078 [Phyllachora maydis]|uniref:DUF1996 domain-containing protein n=1 Tax=Phyllachora maydis TaxID=1825666 RepID=A0AAD9I3L2_9PEZI|nr:hypothetical protein P8C59_005078 [Phyllachora maydis]
MSPRSVLAGLVAAAAVVSAKDTRTFAVLRFYGDGPLTSGRVDPIVHPGTVASHMHTVQGGNAFGPTATGESLRRSTCTSSLIKNDLSAYWAPTLFFQSPDNGSLTQVPLFYMNVYYFFEPTNDDIKPFPTGLQMLSGDPALRSAPVTTGAVNTDPSQGPIQPAQWTCPRSSYDVPSYPPGSDGATAGIQDPLNQAAGMGLPFDYCDGYASPLRMDLHFPSCYNPAAGLADYKNNTCFPAAAGAGRADCPPGWLHMPHLFYELYWDTPAFADAYGRWGAGTPFVLSNGDRTGFSVHGDFLAAWDEPTLQHIIDTCDAGGAGMDRCEAVPGGTNVGNPHRCTIPSPVDEPTTGWLAALPGDNPLAGWGVGNTSATSPAVSPAIPSALLGHVAGHLQRHGRGSRGAHG